MTRYLVQARDRTFVNGYRFLSFAKIMGKKIEKNIHKNVISKYSPKRLDYAKQSATYERKTAAKREIQKTAEATGDSIGNLVKITKNIPQNNQETIKSETEIPKGRYISPEENY